MNILESNLIKSLNKALNLLESKRILIFLFPKEQIKLMKRLNSNLSKLDRSIYLIPQKSSQKRDGVGSSKPFQFLAELPR